MLLKKSKLILRTTCFAIFIILLFSFTFKTDFKVLANSQPVAQLINNEYTRDDVLVADIICDPAYGYDVDSTGKKSSTMALQQAINDCYALGGGTVYLPAGKYLITARIDVKPFVNIVGDYVDPDVYEGDYGTVIVAGVASTSNDVGENHNLFRMQGSSGIIGLTFFYPNQYIDFVMPYAYAIEIPGGITDAMHTTFTIKNITFINAYKGICASITKHSTFNSVTHEQLYLENVKGTVLREGVHLTNSSEVGTFCNVKFSSEYWANAGKEYNAPNKRNIIDFTSANGVGMILGDLEWQQIRDITINDYHTGIYFTEGNRNTDYSMSFIGSFYNLSISGAIYAVYIQQMYANMGIQFAKSVLDGAYSLVNNSPADDGHVQLSGVDCLGELQGRNIYYDGNLPNELPDIEYAQTNYTLPKMKLFNVTQGYGADKTGVSDSSNVIQEALNDARDNGGGIVYLPAGYYRLEKPLNVYANTQLRGSGTSIQRDLIGECHGTLLLAYYGSTALPDTAQALITLVDDNSGVYGFRVVYPEINMFSQVYNSETLPKYSFTVRGSKKGNYAVNLYLEGVYNAVDFSAGNNSLIKKVIGAFYNIGFKVGGNKPIIDNCLQNSICILKVTLPANSDINEWGSTYAQRVEKLHTNIYPVTRYSTKVIVLENAVDAQINNVFSFAANTFIIANNSTFTGNNLGMDSMPSNSGAMFLMNNSTALCYNTLRDACSTVGTYYVDNNSTYTVYNRITLLPSAGMNNEGNIIDDVVMNASKINKSTVEVPQIWTKDVNYTYVEYPSAPENENNKNPNENGNEEFGCGSILSSNVVSGIGCMLLFGFLLKKKRNAKT